MRVASMFAGIGGICLGFKIASYDVVWANDIDRDAVKTYKYNFGKDSIICADIRKIKPESLPDFDILTAGFPCQPFSIRGKQLGFKDSRGNLFFEIARIINVKRPKVIFLENVANILHHDDGRTFLAIYNSLVQLGYFVKYKVLDAHVHAGVPQKRERIFIVAFKDYIACSRFEFPAVVNSNTKLNDFLERSIKQDDKYYYRRSDSLYEELSKIVTNNEALYLIIDRGVSKKPYYIASTLKANMGTFPDRVPVLCDDYGIRKLTERECLNLQGFPMEFEFAPEICDSSKYKQVGNSVCVPLIKELAIKIAEALN